VTVLAVALSVLGGKLAAIYFPFALVYLFCLTLLLTYFRLNQPHYGFYLFIINVIGILTYCFERHWLSMLYSVGAIIILILVWVVIDGLLRWVLNNPNFLVKRSLHALNEVAKQIFVCLMDRNYSDNLYLFERRLHVRKTQYLQHITALRATKAHERAERIDELFLILMDCAQLRRRVTDHTVFGLCDAELLGISTAIQSTFKELIHLTGKSNTLDAIGLAEKIKLLEDSYEHVLKVAAKEPLAFLLFIESLKIFREKVSLYA